MDLSSDSLKDITDETIITELAKREYNQFDPRDNEMTEEIVKIHNQLKKSNLLRWDIPSNSKNSLINAEVSFDEKDCFPLNPILMDLPSYSPM